MMRQQWKRGQQTLRTVLAAAGAVVLVATGLGATSSVASAETQTRTTLVASAERTGTQTKTILTAHVTDAVGNALQNAAGAGTVSFDMISGARSLGAAAVDGEGNATLSLTSLPAATSGTSLAVQAVYHPATAAATGEDAETSSATVAGSVSSQALVEPAATGVPDFTITGNPTSLTTNPGGYVTSLLTVTPINGFNEQVTLSCSNLPAQVVCNFSPVIASTAAGAFTSTLQITTQAASGALTPLDPGRSSHIAFAWALPGLLALAGFASLRRKALGRMGSTGARYMGVALLLVAGTLGMTGMTGCSQRYGYNHHPPSVATGTLAGTYTILVSASGNDGSAVTSHNLSITLQVQ